MCKSLGGNLLELESKEEFIEMVTYVLSEPTIRGIFDYFIITLGCPMSII